MNLETANKIKREIYNYLSQIYQEYSKNRNSTLKSKYDALLAEYGIQELTETYLAQIVQKSGLVQKAVKQTPSEKIDTKTWNK